MTPHHVSSNLLRSMHFSGSVLQHHAGASKSRSSETTSSAYLKTRVKNGVEGDNQQQPTTSYLSSPKLQTVERNSLESKKSFKLVMPNMMQQKQLDQQTRSISGSLASRS